MVTTCFELVIRLLSNIRISFEKVEVVLPARGDGGRRITPAGPTPRSDYSVSSSRPSRTAKRGMLVSDVIRPTCRTVKSDTK